MNITIEKTSKKLKKRLIIATTVFFAIIIFIMFFSGNKYNKDGIINPSGRTISDIASERGISVAQLKEEYSLPKDMRADTLEAAAYYNIPTEKMAEMNSMTFEEFAEMFGWGDGIKPDTPWGEAQGETLLRYMYRSEKALDSFKKQYNLGDDVTGETKYKEVRDRVSAETPELAKLR